MMFIRFKSIVTKFLIPKPKMACIQEFCDEMATTQFAYFFNITNEVAYKWPIAPILPLRHVELQVSTKKHMIWLSNNVNFCVPILVQMW